MNINMNINTSSIIKTILLILLPLTSAIIYAESGLHEQKAHIHGVSKIELMISDETIRINIKSPVNNIVGFEHVASNIEEKVISKGLTRFYRRQHRFLASMALTASLSPAQSLLMDSLKRQTNITHTVHTKKLWPNINSNVNQAKI
jgi:hypothetical protein